MASSDLDKSSKDKDSKTVTTAAVAATQEQSSATSTGPVNPEWPVYQAYSPMPAHSYLASSPQAHPYMWGVQHMVPPYGAPPPYVAMYPHHGGIYAHPSMPPGSYPFSPFAMPSPNGMAEASGNTPVAAEADGKSSEGKEKLPIKRSKGSLGSLNMITGKKSDAAKASTASANGGHSKSRESGSEGSSDGSDANSQNDSQMKSGDRQDSAEAETSQNGSSLHSSQNGGSGTPKTTISHKTALVPVASGAPSVPGPATNLNIGMEYWGTPSPSPAPVLRGSVPSVPVVGANVTAGARDVQPQLWLQDERELKRQRRKQSNRESARRSRLRKQAECDELAQRAEILKEENAALRAEVNRVRASYEQLAAENSSLKERLGENPGNEETRSSRDKETLGKDTQ